MPLLAHLAPGLVLLLLSSTEGSPQCPAVTQLLPSLSLPAWVEGGFKGTGTFPGGNWAGSSSCPWGCVTWDSCWPL